MKINVFTSFRLKTKVLYKFILVMKIAFFILLTSFLGVSASVYSQKVSISVNNASLKEVLEQLKRQTAYNFLYSTEILKNSRSISLEVSNVEFIEVLDRCFKDQPLDFTVRDKTVVIRQKPIVIKKQ